MTKKTKADLVKEIDVLKRELGHIREQMEQKNEAAVVLSHDEKETVLGLLESVLSENQMEVEVQMKIKAVRSILNKQTLIEALGAMFDMRSFYSVRYLNVGDKKINVIKTIRELTGLGLKEAKEFSESAPQILIEKTDKETAFKFKRTLEEAGATVEVERVAG